MGHITPLLDDDPAIAALLITLNGDEACNDETFPDILLRTSAEAKIGTERWLLGSTLREYTKKRRRNSREIGVISEDSDPSEVSLPAATKRARTALPYYPGLPLPRASIDGHLRARSSTDDELDSPVPPAPALDFDETDSEDDEDDTVVVESSHLDSTYALKPIVFSKEPSIGEQRLSYLGRRPAFSVQIAGVPADFDLTSSRRKRGSAGEDTAASTGKSLELLGLGDVLRNIKFGQAHGSPGSRCMNGCGTDGAIRSRPSTTSALAAAGL